jgi:hypothetical protein
MLLDGADLTATVAIMDKIPTSSNTAVIDRKDYVISSTSIRLLLL